MKCWLLNDMDIDVALRELGDFLNEMTDAARIMPEWCQFVNIYDMRVEVGTNPEGKIWLKDRYVERPDAAICFFAGNLVRGGDLLFARQILDQLEMLGTFCLQSTRQLAVTADKLKCSQILAAAGVPVPATILITDNTPASLLIEKLGLPLVVKPNDGQEGHGVCLIETEHELKNLLELRDRRATLIAQQYISTSRGRDMRIALLGDDIIYAMIRDNTKSGDFRSNIAQGGTTQSLTPPADALAIARKAHRALGLNIGSVDLLFGDGCYYVGEANSIPGYSNHQQYEGEDVSERYKRLIMQFMAKTLNIKQ